MPTTEETRSIKEFEMSNNGKNPHGFTVLAEPSGDPGLFDELRIRVFKNAGATNNSDKSAVADVLIGLDMTLLEPRVLITTGGHGDGDHTIAAYPLRSGSGAVEPINGRFTDTELATALVNDCESEIGMYMSRGVRTIAFNGLLSGMTAVQEDNPRWGDAFKLASRLGVAIKPMFGYTGSLEQTISQNFNIKNGGSVPRIS